MKLYKNASGTIVAATDDNDLINDANVGVGNWCTVTDSVWTAAQYNSGNTLVNGVFTAGKTLADYKRELEEIYETKIVADLTIDSREITIGMDEFTMMKAYAESSLTTVKWKLKDGTYHSYSAADFDDLYAEVVGYKHDTDSNKASKLTALDDAADPSTVDLTTGWASTTITT